MSEKTKLDWALELWELGFHVIPLGDPTTAHKRPDGVTIEQWCKKPLIPWKEYQTRCPSEQELRHWFGRKWPNANPGIVTGTSPPPGPGSQQGVAVIDADTEEAVDFIETAIKDGRIPFTPWKSETARGYHYYYRYDPIHEIKNSAGQNKIDVRARGGYVVAPGAVHYTGKRYRWIRTDGIDMDSIDDLPVLTESTLEIIFSFGMEVKNDSRHFDPENVVIPLASVRAPASGDPVDHGERNVSAASLVGQYLKRGLALDEIKVKMVTWNNNNHPPLSEDELFSTIASIAYKTLEKQAIQLHPNRLEYLDQGYTRENIKKVVKEIQSIKSKIKIFQFKQLNTYPPPEPEKWMGQGILFQGARVMIAGPAKQRKSTFFLSMGFCAAMGMPFLDMPFLKPLRVAWIQAEIHEGFLRSRFDMLTKNLLPEQRGILDENFYATGRLRLDLRNPDQKDELFNMLAQIKPQIVCFDPLINFSSINENDNREMHELLSIVDQVEDYFGAAVVVVHHTRKSNNGTFEDIRGAGALRGWYDTGLMISGDPALPSLSYDLRNGPPVPSHGLQFLEDKGRWQVAVHPDETPPNDLPADDARLTMVREIILSSGGIMAGTLRNRIMKLAGVKERKARQLIQATLERFSNEILVETNGTFKTYSKKPSFS